VLRNNLMAGVFFTIRPSVLGGVLQLLCILPLNYGALDPGVVCYKKKTQNDNKRSKKPM